MHFTSMLLISLFSFGFEPIEVEIISACELNISDELLEEFSLYYNYYDSLINVAKLYGKFDSAYETGNTMISILNDLTFANILTIEVAGKLELQLSNFNEDFNIRLIGCNSKREKLRPTDFQILIDHVSYYRASDVTSITAKIKVTNFKSNVIVYDDFLTVNSSDEYFRNTGYSIIHSLNLELANRIIYGIL